MPKATEVILKLENLNMEIHRIGLAVPPALRASLEPSNRGVMHNGFFANCRLETGYLLIPNV